MLRYSQVTTCRVCHAQDMHTVLDLGVQALTGVFPRNETDIVTAGPLQLLSCSNCGLLQLRHSYEPTELYGHNYGYRSGLNQSMVDHLTRKARMLERHFKLQPGDVVLDIGSNDATTLKAYTAPGIRRLGIDPTAAKFAEFYTEDIELKADFFSPRAFASLSDRYAKIITSIAMFYDLEDPIAFARDVSSCLAPDGIWHFEQSYMPSMLRLNSYDTVCHEHLEYYSFDVIKRILQEADMVCLDVSMNSVNGGSFAVTAAKRGSPFTPNEPLVDWLISHEGSLALQTMKPYRSFAKRVLTHRNDLIRLVTDLRRKGRHLLGYGASTKGNVLLQYCGFDKDDILAIADVNPDKFGCRTPGSNIPIVSEQEAREIGPDYYLVLPWHFRDNILRRENAFVEAGGRFIFPFPAIEVI